jgi:hypothetical protein
MKIHGPTRRFRYLCFDACLVQTTSETLYTRSVVLLVIGYGSMTYIQTKAEELLNTYGRSVPGLFTLRILVCSYCVVCTEPFRPRVLPKWSITIYQKQHSKKGCFEVVSMILRTMNCKCQNFQWMQCSKASFHTNNTLVTEKLNTNLLDVCFNLKKRKVA